MSLSKEGNSYSWSFKLDKIHDYAYYDNFLSKKECEEIIKLAKTKQLIEGSIYGAGIKPDTRNSSICWLAPTDGLQWLYKRLTDCVTTLNNKYFGFDLSGIQEGIQFTNYKAPNGKFAYHMDRLHQGVIRKLSITIQLTDPKEYEGGELELKIGNKPMIMKKDQGRLLMFPSFFLHQVNTITKGERNSLVVWITGSQFK